MTTDQVIFNRMTVARYAPPATRNPQGQPGLPPTTLDAKYSSGVAPRVWSAPLVQFGRGLKALPRWVMGIEPKHSGAPSIPHLAGAITVPALWRTGGYAYEYSGPAYTPPLPAYHPPAQVYNPPGPVYNPPGPTTTQITARATSLAQTAVALSTGNLGALDSAGIKPALTPTQQNLLAKSSRLAALQ